MYTKKPIKNAKGIHPEKKMYRVMTAPYTDPKLDEFIKAGALSKAGIQIMEVDSVRRNESRTGVIVEGILIEKDGSPLYPEDAKKNGIKTEVPYDQQNVEVKPGTWFDDKDLAQEFAAIINKKTKDTSAAIRKLLDKIEQQQDELITKGA